MDRLPALMLAVLVACSDAGAPPAPSARRVDAVKADRKRAPSLDELCDKRHPEGGPTFAWPALAGATPPSVSTWRWVNVWATWCKPCVEELPRLRRWQARLGGRIDLQLLSVDESDAAVATYRQEHPETPAGPRLADPAALPAFLTSLGLDAAAPIPVHVLVDARGAIRCVRAGAVSDADLAAIEPLVAP